MAKKDKKAKKVQKYNPNPCTSTFDGGAWAMLGWPLLIALVGTLSLGIALPWLLCEYYRWYAKHTKINGYHVVFDGKGGQLFWKNVAWFFLGIVTFTIYWWLMVPVRKQQWIMKHTYVEETAVANAQYPQQCAQQPAPYYGQYYYPCAPQAPVYPQNGCCRYYR